MGPNYIALAIPLFFVFIGLEVFFARRQARKVYRFADAISDLGCGISQQMFVRFWDVALLAVYALLYERFRMVTYPSAWMAWLVGFVGVDFLYYWWHRASHEVNFLWAVHVVHHQSEDYNLAVALRQAIFSGVTTFPFYAVLAFLGVPTLVFATTLALSTLYQFWIHSELIPKLGPFESVFNTASLHRVHHAVNPRYLDRNYAATLIVWDRLFGSWQEEDEVPVYGTSKPLRSFNPVWAQFHSWRELYRLARRAPGFLEACQVWIRSPAWHPKWDVDEGEARQLSPELLYRYNPRVHPSVTPYVGVQFVLTLGVAFSLLMWGRGLPLWEAVGVTAWVYASVVGASALLEGRPWVRLVETGRLLFGAVLAGGIAWHHGLIPGIALGWVVALPSVVWLARVWQRTHSLRLVS